MDEPKKWFDVALDGLEPSVRWLQEFARSEREDAVAHAQYFLGAISATCSILAGSDYSNDRNVKARVIVRLRQLIDEVEVARQLSPREVDRLQDLMRGAMIDLDG